MAEQRSGEATTVNGKNGRLARKGSGWLLGVVVIFLALGSLGGNAGGVSGARMAVGDNLPRRQSVTAAEAEPVVARLASPTVKAGLPDTVWVDYRCPSDGGCAPSETVTLWDYGSLARLRYQQYLGYPMGPTVTVERGKPVAVPLPRQTVAGLYHVLVTARGVALHLTYRVLPNRPVGFLATLSPSPFLTAGSVAQVMVAAVDAYGNPVAGVGVPIRVAVEGEGFRLQRLRAGITEAQPAALIQAERGARAATVVVTSSRYPHQRFLLPVRVIASPAQLVAGKGAWASLATWDALGPSAILARLTQEGVTHLYLQTAVGKSFFAAHLLDQILTQAHNRGIAVIAWDYAPLTAVSQDTAAAQAAIRFRAPLEDQVDGLAGDFEENLAASAVSAFSRGVRAALGPRRAYVAVIYAPQFGFPTPVATLAHYVNVIAPMDYWLGTPRSLSYADVYHFVQASLIQLRQRLGTHPVPVEVIGQTQDLLDSSGFGRYNPPVYQLAAAYAAAKAGGAIGISFYDLRTQTPAQVRAIAHFSFAGP
ncbi:MAG: hypothetical protein OWU84_15145 [Firmicutes bacterium]|nr:hypothetical protein [Bacillota bacterium]